MLKGFAVVLGACVSIAAGCAPASRPPSVAMPKQPGKVATTDRPTYPPDPEDKPHFEQRSGKTAATELPSARATVTARLQTPQATYLLLHATHENVLTDTTLDSVTDKDGRPIVAAVAGSGSLTQSLAEPVYDLVLRLGGPMRTVTLTDIQWTSRGSWQSSQWQGGYRQVLTVTGAESAPVRKTLEAEFAESMANWFGLAAHREPFSAFAATRTLRKLAKSSAVLSLKQAQAARARVELLELMDFYTGRSAINDSLQFQRGLQLSRGPQRSTEPIEVLMQQSQETTRSPATDSSNESCAGCSAISAYVPANALVLEFSALKEMVQLPRLLDRKLGTLLRIAEATGGSSYLVERYRRQLALELDGFAETVGQFAVKNGAIVLSDPYLREGTDVTLIFRAENSSLLQGVLENHLQRAKREHPDLRTTQERIEGQGVTLHSTPDGTVRRFEHGFDDYRVLSNSRAAMARILRVKQGLLPRLSQDIDYATARAQRHDGNERAWLYFGSGFVENLVGPHSKILESRRVRAKSELAAVDHAALLFGWMEGHRATSLAELLQSGWLESADLIHFDGTPITWTAAGGAHSRWGFAQSLLPISDLQIGKVSRAEVSAYRAFRRNYEATMNGMLDPTMLRFKRTANDEDIRTELSVFPIPIGGRFNTEFRHVAELVGDGRIEAGQASAGLSASIAVGEGSPLRDLFDSNVGRLFAKRAITASFVGNWAKIGLDEGSAIWDLAGREHLLPTAAGYDRGTLGGIDVDDMVVRLPIWAAVHVRSRLLLTAALAALRTKLTSDISDHVKWYEDAKYRGIQLTRVHVRQDGSTDAASANVYYAVARDVLLISLRRDVLKSRIDEVLAGRTPRGVPIAKDATQLALDWAPSLNGWLQNTAAAILDQAAMDAHERACVGLRVLALGHQVQSEPPVQRRNSALRLLGYEPESLQGGELKWQNGQCTDGTYGTLSEPVVPNAQNPSLVVHQLVAGISLLRAALGIAPFRDALELRAKFELSNRATHSHP